MEDGRALDERGAVLALLFIQSLDELPRITRMRTSPFTISANYAGTEF